MINILNLSDFQRRSIFVFIIALVSLLIGYIATSSSSIFTFAFLVIAAIPIVVVYYKKPTWGLFTYIFLLPIHSLMITILIAQLNVPLSIARAIAAWKEALLIGIVSIAGFHVLLKHKVARLVWVDYIAAIWLLLIIFYFIFQDTLFGQEYSLIVKLYGARDWLLFILPYLIGRFIFFSEQKITKLVNAIIIVGLLTSIFGIFEYIFIPLDWHIQLGVPFYFKEFLNQPFPDYLFGLPHNYWAETPVGTLRRAVSTYLSGQGFAIPFLVIFPATIYFYYTSKKPLIYRLIALAIISLGLLLSFTRMTIITCIIQGFLLLGLLKRQRTIIWIALGLMVVVLIAIGVNEPFRGYIWNTITFSDTSSSSRPTQWVEGIKLLIEKPLGQGLGAVGLTGDRFGFSGLGSEAGYFMITGALGFPGLVLYLLWFAGIMYFSFFGYLFLSQVRSGLTLVVFVIMVGILINNLTAPPNQSPFTIYISGWLAGLAVQLSINMKRNSRGIELNTARAAAPTKSSIYP